MSDIIWDYLIFSIVILLLISSIAHMLLAAGASYLFTGAVCTVAVVLSWLIIVAGE